MSIKQQLYRYCISMAENKVREAEEALNHLQKSHESEGKSSMGDKYETGRAMIHLEKEKVGHQLNEALKMRQMLAGIDVEKAFGKVGVGSLVETEVARYFIATSLGKVVLDEANYFVISPLSPIGQAMLNKTVGDMISFAGKTQKIITVS